MILEIQEEIVGKIKQDDQECNFEGRGDDWIGENSIESETEQRRNNSCNIESCDDNKVKMLILTLFNQAFQQCLKKKKVDIRS